jgi:hypothetical protein
MLQNLFVVTDVNKLEHLSLSRGALSEKIRPGWKNLTSSYLNLRNQAGKVCHGETQDDCREIL